MSDSRTTRAAWLVIAVVALCASSGCVQRRLTIRSNPPGALVYIDKYEIGTTPVSTDFIYYGTREVKLVKDGFETVVALEPLSPPAYDYPGVDFFTENLVPFEFRDERTLNYTLTPQKVMPTDEILARANGLRQGSTAPIPPGTLQTPSRPRSIEPITPVPDLRLPR